jgi:Ca-activated chloride channel family protein
MRFDKAQTVAMAMRVAAFMMVCPTPTGATGLLVPKDRSLPPLALAHQRVEVAIEDGTSLTKVDQVFRNHTSQVLEATYIFPVPDGATLDDFALYIGGERVEGKVLEAGHARAVYEDIVRRMQDPGLIEWVGKDLFQARVFPIPANGDQRVEIAFSQILPMDAGVFRYTYPLKGVRAPGERTLGDLTLTARLRSKTPIRNVYSPSHDVYVKKTDDHTATVGFEREQAAFDDDFVLFYTVGVEELGMNVLAYRPDSDPGYFLLMISPKSSFATQKHGAKTVTFVVDTSGSMSGDKLEHTKASLRHGLEQLRSDDHFSLIRFSSDVERWRGSFQVASPSNVRDALAFVDGLEAAGGTAIHEALTEATRHQAPSVHYVVFLTDGRPTVGETDVERITADVAKANARGARVFSFGVGEDLNAHLLDRLAQDNGGTSAYVGPDAELTKVLTSFFDKLAYPALADVKLEVRSGDVYAMLPKAIPDLFRGEQLLVTGRYRKPGDTLVRVTGTLDGKPVSYDYETALPKAKSEHAFIAKLWAQRQVGFLLDEIRLSGETGELRGEVVQLATRYGIVTPYTSYLVVEPGHPTEIPRPGRPTPIPRRERVFRSGDAGGASGVGGMGKAESSAPSGAPAASADFYLESEEQLQAAEGEVAVRTAKKVQKMKDSSRADTDDALTVRYVGGLSFAWTDGRWVDSRLTGEMKTLKVKYLSDAWFRILELAPSLRDALALGEEVTVVHRGVALVIGPSGAETLSEADAARLR